MKKIHHWHNINFLKACSTEIKELISLKSATGGKMIKLHFCTVIYKAKNSPLKMSQISYKNYC